MIPEQDPDAKAVAAQIFRADLAVSTLAPLFTDRLPHRALGFPFYQHDLTDEQWTGLLAALREAGLQDTQAFAAVFFTRPGYWRIPLNAQEPYRALIERGWPSIYESAIYSVDGAWAIAVADEEFALAAGPPAFIASLRGHMPEFSDESLASFLMEWKSVEQRPAADRREPGRINSEIFPWIVEVLRHVYGDAADRPLAYFDSDS